MENIGSPDSLQSSLEILENATGLSDQLSIDPRRQAVPSIRGTVYQAWWSIDAWLQLTDANEVIYLEGAEDFDLIKADDFAVTVQVRQTKDSISLGTTKAREALAHFWSLASNETRRRVDFHYLTTSSIAMEIGADFAGLTGIEAWRVAHTSPELAQKVVDYLKKKLAAGSPLREFVASAPLETVQERLLQRFHWLTDQPDIDAVKRSVDDRLAVLLSQLRRSLSFAAAVRNHLESRFWEIIVDVSDARRILTRAELLRQIDRATTVNLPISLDQIPNLFGIEQPGLSLLNLLVQKVPKPPKPLLKRAALTGRLTELVKQRKVVLITGTVNKGKTTLAQLVLSDLCLDAWWVNLTERRLNEVDNLFLGLAQQMDSGNCPGLIVVDDLDTSEKAYRGYGDSLRLLMHRAQASGRGVILTAQGATSQSPVIRDSYNVALLEVDELTHDETALLCIEHGCPEKLAPGWGVLLAASTLGHPKLVQVRIAELMVRRWPSPSDADLTEQSAGVTSAKQIARRLLHESVSASVAEFIYTAAECSVAIHQSVALRLAETFDGFQNAGDVLEELAGKWLERIGGNWFRVTALLRGAGQEVWSPERRKRAHIQLHDAIAAKEVFDPAEAAALLFHAYLGGESSRIALTAIRLQVLSDDEAKRQVERHLLWLPWVALDAGQQITDDAVAGAMLRALQFRVASTLDTDSLVRICERWGEDIQRIPDGDLKTAALTMKWMLVGFSMSTRVPLRFRLEAVVGFPALPEDLRQTQSASLLESFARGAETGDLPPSGSISQAILLCAGRTVRDLESLDELLNWLDTVATADIREQFDSMLEWPLVQTLGAFVQTAWSAKHDEIDDWHPWLALFERIARYAEARSSPRFGHEAAKARAIILTEYLSQNDEALAVLDNATRVFGPSAVLLEQRANVRFHMQDYASVLEIWEQLARDPDTKSALDPFAYRRAAISASRLERWLDAANIFYAAAELVPVSFVGPTKVGLIVDAALARSFGGDQVGAVKMLATAVSEFPEEASLEGDARWEAVLRAASQACAVIQHRVWATQSNGVEVEPGQASSPDLQVSKSEPGQGARYEMTSALIIHLSATVDVGAPKTTKPLELLERSSYFPVRWVASEAQLAFAFASGAGAGFIAALLAFERATADVEFKKTRLSFLEPDQGPQPTLSIAPERWFGFLVAGAVCAGPYLLDHLRLWLDDATSQVGSDAPLSQHIGLLLAGASQPADALEATVGDLEKLPALRCGAAASRLLGTRNAETALRLQLLLVSALTSDSSLARQVLCNRHVARRFADCWRNLSQDQYHFQFRSPRVTIPLMVRAIDNVDQGNGTLRSLLIAAHGAIGGTLGEIAQKVY